LQVTLVSASHATGNKSLNLVALCQKQRVSKERHVVLLGMTAQTYLQEARRLKDLPPKQRYNDLFLAFGAIAIVAMIVIPLPKALVDVLLGVSIATGVGMLLMAIYIPAPSAFSTFPSVIMISTLFRLSLSIATAKLILIYADGGQIIDTFGKLITGGNLVVGLVIFVIITVVQFLVIAKGAERVAEVGARFTLDAMPGKQLSIDADLRAGLLDKDEAREKRRMLELESQLHGSLDGAMKFVKNEAIAGIVIVVVNLAAGLVIGMLQRDMTFGEALKVYSILTIGEGLVAQLPSILGAVAAGLFVTRVAGEGQTADLGAAISHQLTKQPRVFLITALMCFLMMWVPGFPKLAFLLLTLCFGGFGAYLLREQIRERVDAMLRARAAEEQDALAEDKQEPPVKVQEFSAAIPVLIDLSTTGRTEIDLEELERDIDFARENLYYETGVMFPPAFVRFGLDVEPDRYRIYIFEVPTADGPMRGDKLFLDAPEQAARDLGLALEAGEPVLLRGPTWWLDPAELGTLRVAGLNALTAHQLVVQHFVQTLRRQSHQFLGVQEVNYLINKMAVDYPDLIKEMLRAVPLQKVADILRRLAQEGVSIRNLRDIFESLAEWGQREKDVVLLSEYARMGLKRYLSNKYAGNSKTLGALLVGPDVEDKFRQSIRVTNAGSYLALDTEVASQILGGLRELLGRVMNEAAANQNAAVPQAHVLLSSMDIRRYVRSLTENEFFDLPVLSYQELSPDIRIQTMGQLTL
jgi:type III secretion protein V